MRRYTSPTTGNSDGEYLPRHYMNERQAACYLSVSVSLVRKWRRYRLGPSWTKLGNCVRYQAADLDDYARSRREEAGP